MTTELIAIQYLGLAFAGIVFVLFIVSKMFSNKNEKKQAKRMYSCGMGLLPHEFRLPQESFYNYLKKITGAEKISALHSGKLTTYMIWIVVGAAIILSLAMVLW